MNEEQENHAKIALWLGYRTHQVFTRNWFTPEAGIAGLDSETIPLPDFINNPAHYERIKARLRELGVHYKLDYTPNLEPRLRHGISLSGGGMSGECGGYSEGEILVWVALTAIKRGL